MNNRGFTLVELLGVITILAIILAIVFPTVTSVINRSKNTVDSVQTNKILSGAYDYSIKKSSLLPDVGKTTYITLNELKKYGYVDSDITNPDTNEMYSNDIVISITNVGKGYKENKKNSMLQGDYLYKINNKNNKCDPIITIDNKEALVTINIGGNYVEPTYSALDCNENDITNKVIKNITKDGKNVNKIDSYKNGIYVIDYCVVDDKGNVVCEKISVVVKDNEIPTLTIPENITLDTSITKYNLMEGVECEDNSNKCDINIEGNIEFGVAGKYIVKYIAIDPAGNTCIKKRVITIE